MLMCPFDNGFNLLWSEYALVVVHADLDDIDPLLDVFIDSGFRINGPFNHPVFLINQEAIRRSRFEELSTWRADDRA